MRCALEEARSALGRDEPSEWLMGTVVMQKLINKPADAVIETLEGLAFAFPELLRVAYEPHFVYRADAPVQGKVTLLGGSGSGHEPLNIGYVGHGMLDAACPGPVFTSPMPIQYIEAARAVYGGAGALFVIKNYMGGVLNIELAIEALIDEGLDVQSVLVYDDVAVEDVDNRRALGATVLVEKIAGAAAEAGMTLDRVTEIATRVSRSTRSMGVALTSCTVPALGEPTFRLPVNQAELGVGIHGEPGRSRVELTQADELIERLLEPICSELALGDGSRVLALVNGLGATPQQELYIVNRYLHTKLGALGIHVERSLVGNYITSLDMAGCSITLMCLDDELLSLWDAPVHTPALRW